MLNYLPKGKEKQAQEHVQAISMAKNREESIKAFDDFESAYRAKHPKAAECLSKDREVLLTFDDFPAEHWVHLRTTNPVESTFATVRLRTNQTRDCLSRETAFTMVLKLCRSAEKRWRRLNGCEHRNAVIKGERFQDSVRVQEDAA